MKIEKNSSTTDGKIEFNIYLIFILLDFISRFVHCCFDRVFVNLILL